MSWCKEGTKLTFETEISGSSGVYLAVEVGGVFVDIWEWISAGFCKLGRVMKHGRNLLI